MFTFSNDSLDKFLTKLIKETANIVRFGNQSKEVVLNRYNIKELTKLPQLNTDLKNLYARMIELYNKKFNDLYDMYENPFTDLCHYEKIISAQVSYKC